MATAAVIEALEAQLGCYQRLAKLAQIQHEHIQQSQTDALIEVLRDRQTVMTEITSFERIVGPAKREWSAFVAGLPDASRDRAQSLLDETRRLLEEINDSDRKDVLVLQQRKLNLGRQINQASSARHVTRQYATAAYGPAKSNMDVQH